MNDYLLFKVWIKMCDVDLDRLSWQQVKRLMADFENEKRQNTSSYIRALNAYKKEESPC